jgi:hypothetical protein
LFWLHLAVNSPSRDLDGRTLLQNGDTPTPGDLLFERDRDIVQGELVFWGRVFLVVARPFDKVVWCLLIEGDDHSAGSLEELVGLAQSSLSQESNQGRSVDNDAARQMIEQAPAPRVIMKAARNNAAAPNGRPQRQQLQESKRTKQHLQVFDLERGVTHEILLLLRLTCHTTCTISLT